MTKNRKAGNGNIQQNKSIRMGGHDGSPYVGGVIGALVGAAVGAVAVRALSDKRTRGKITDLMEHTFDVLRDINDERQGVQKVVGNIVDDVKDAAEKRLLHRGK